ncbi:MAG: DUF4416 family protein [Candidatus Calescibacterium sp.]|jgi:hypothetical protein
MSYPKEPDPVKFFAAILFSEEEGFIKAKYLMMEYFGRFDFESETKKFDVSNYYKDEMGENIFRTFISFETLRPPDFLVEMKLKSAEIEIKLAYEGKRKVNIDPGYVDFSKVILATFKGAGSKIYLAKGVWADFILRYERGKFHSFPWTFPDFRDGRYDEILISIRNLYKEQMRNLKGTHF